MTVSGPNIPETPPAGADPPHLPVLALIEDDRTTLSALRRIFTRLGWDVRTASTVADGLGLVDLHPSGMILDLMLPDGDGLEVLKRVRSENLTIRVVVTTGVVDREWLDRVRQLHPDELLSKPVEFDVLLRVIGSSPTE